MEVCHGDTCHMVTKGWDFRFLSWSRPAVGEKAGVWSPGSESHV